MPQEMLAILHSICRDEEGLFQVTVSLGPQPPRVFRVSFDDSEPGFTFVNSEQELFWALSDMAHRRFGDCTVYQFELMKLIAAFSNGDAIPTMPAVLGTTSFCTTKPSPLRVAWNKLRVFLRRIGLCRPHGVVPSASREAT